MSSSILMDSELHPSVATQTEIQEESEINEEVLYTGRFYWTNAGFPKELDCSNAEYTKSPLRSFHPLPQSLPSGSEIFRVSTDTTVKHTKKEGGKKRRKDQLNYGRPCYLVKYDKSTNQGVIFLGTSTKSKNADRFVIVHSRRGEEIPGTNETKFPPLLPGALGTEPPYSFRSEITYLNISHPLQVRFKYFPDKFITNGTPYDMHEPPLVGIRKIPTQPAPDGSERFVELDQESKSLFWEKHKEYHIHRPKRIRSKDVGDGAGPNDGDGGPGTGGAGPSTGGAGPNTGGAGPGTGGAGPGRGGAGPSTSGVGSNRGVFSSREIDDAPWGRVGDQRIGIDIPLVTEDIYSDSNEEMDCESDEEMNFEEFGITSDAIDAPWGRVGDQRIGIDIPLVTEDIYSDSNEEMDCESDEEFQEVENVANIVKSESFDEKGITTGSNPSDKDSCWSNTIPKPYFVMFDREKNTHVLLDYNHMAGEWRLTTRLTTRLERRRPIHVLIEGLVYEHHFNSENGASVHEIFNWHTKNSIILNLPEDKLLNQMIGMSVDTSVQPYAFKVILGNGWGTTIYDSTTHSWTHQLSVPPRRSRCRFSGSANVASCKGIVFMIDEMDQIVLYDTEKDKWHCIQGPEQHIQLSSLHVIGSWDDRVFVSNANLWYDQVFQIWELMGMANLEWKKFDAMPKDIFIWLVKGETLHPIFEFDVSYCSESLLIWSKFISQPTRFVLYNLAHKTWEKLELPFSPLTDLEPRSLLTPEQIEKAPLEVTLSLGQTSSVRPDVEPWGTHGLMDEDKGIKHREQSLEASDEGKGEDKDG